MCRSMADIRSTAAEIRRGKKRKIERKKDEKKLQDKNIMAPLLHRAAIIRHVSTIGKNLLNSNVSPICPHNMVNFGPAIEICWRVS